MGNYEKKYKAALSRARDLHDNHPLGQPQTLMTLETIFPELNESEDERIRKRLIEIAKIWKNGGHAHGYSDEIDDILAWLENQRHDGKKWIYEDVYLKEKEQLIQDGIDEVLENPQKYGLEKQGEQKPSDNGEPKFKFGDWIINNDKRIAIPTQILKIEEYGYVTSMGYISFDKVKTDYHLWTIKDAKDCDVLSSKNPFIFNGFRDKNHPNSPTAYCGINSSGTFILSEENAWWTWTAGGVHPATKEQHDILFAKMKEEGYEWDAEKKELTKIEQKTADKKVELTEFERAIAVYIMQQLAKYTEEQISNIQSVSKKIMELAMKESQEQKYDWE